MKTTFKSTLVENQGTKFLSDEASIKEWLDKYGVKDYSINGDFTVSVNGPLALDNKGLEEIPVKFSEVNGSIDVTTNRLKRIDWAPAKVNGNFDAWDNEIETLVGGPAEVENSMDVDGNKLTDLHGAPKKVGKCFIVSKNPLKTLAGCPEVVKGYFKAAECGLTQLDDLPREIGTNLYIQDNELKSLKGINKLLKHLNVANSAKGGKINISKNPIENGLSSCLAIKGFKELYIDQLSSIGDKSLKPATSIINSAIAAGEDAFDVQEKLLDSEYAKFA